MSLCFLRVTSVITQCINIISNNFEIDSHDNFNQSKIYSCDFHHGLILTLIFTKLLIKFTLIDFNDLHITNN